MKEKKQKQKTKDAKGHLGRHKFIFPKNLPEYWEEVYRIQFKRFKRKYSNEKYITDPTVAVLVEGLAYLNTRLQYVESKDYFTEEIKVLEDKFEFERLHDRIQTNLLKAITQIERLTKIIVVNRPPKKDVEVEVLSVSDVMKLSDEEISKKITKQTGRTKDTPGGAKT